MFTGIIEEIGTVKNVKKGGKSAVLTIFCKDILADVKIGDSIAVNGICLTVVSFTDEYFTADVMNETLSRVKGFDVGDRVNLERALSVKDRLGGHIVSGHIDGTGVIAFSVYPLFRTHYRTLFCNIRKHGTLLIWKTT